MRIILALFMAAATLHSCNLRAGGPGDGNGINWITINQADSLRRTAPRKVLIDVYTDWCGWCKRMDQTTFSDPRVAKFISEHFYAVKLDGEQRTTINLGGKDYNFVPNGSRGYNELAAALLQNKMSYPTIVYLDENMNMIQPMPGYRTADDLLPILAYLAGDHHRSVSFEEFQKTYKAE
jgi:thioredoxin-related protein